MRNQMLQGHAKFIVDNFFQDEEDVAVSWVLPRKHLTAARYLGKFLLAASISDSILCFSLALAVNLLPLLALREGCIHPGIQAFQHLNSSVDTHGSATYRLILLCERSAELL